MKFGIMGNGLGKLLLNKSSWREHAVKANKMNQPNPGIRCVVDTCYFYMNGDKCSADKIDVEPKNATSIEQTDCSTFTKK